ncbi:MAG: Zn-ribbon containing protein [archaeon]
MPHQCVKCGTLYDDGSGEILKGCTCGGKLFFYIKKSALERKEEIINLSKKEKQQIEDDVYDIIGDQIDREKPIVLDIETIKILKPGKYEIDLVNLFKKQPLIYKLADGKYVIDIIESFKKMRKEED